MVLRNKQQQAFVEELNGGFGGMKLCGCNKATVTALVIHVGAASDRESSSPTETIRGRRPLPRLTA